MRSAGDGFESVASLGAPSRVALSTTGDELTREKDRISSGGELAGNAVEMARRGEMKRASHSLLWRTGSESAGPSGIETLPSSSVPCFSVSVEEGGASGGTNFCVSTAEECAEQPVRRRRSLYGLFVLLGMTSLMGWNFVIQTLPFILTQKLGMRQLNNLFLGIYQVANILMQLLLLALPKHYPSLAVFASAGSGILGMLIALCVAVSPSVVEDESILGADATGASGLNSNQRLLLGGLLSLDVLMGCCQGLIQGVGYTVASSVAPGYVSAVSLGQGLAGLLVFSISTVSCFLIFDVSTARGLTDFCLLSFGFTACAALAFAVFLYAKLHSAELVSKLELACPTLGGAEEGSHSEQTSALRSERRVGSIGFRIWGCEESRTRIPTGAVSTTVLPRRPLWVNVFIAGWRELLLALFHFAYTYNLYPNMGPLGWKYSWEFKNQVVVMYGAWFFFETLGRASPDLVWLRCFRCLRLSRGRYACVSVGSLVFLGPFLAGYLMDPGSSFLTNPIWYVFVLSAFAFCHGWIGTLAFFFACNAVEDPREKKVAGPLTVLSVGVGCVIGFLSALAY